MTAFSSPASFTTAAQTPQSTSKQHEEIGQYSEARRLPVELERQCQIFLEEQLYVKAIHMLNQMLVSGQTRRDGCRKRVYVPPPEQIALIMTLVIHPHRTTRIKEHDDVEVVSTAWTYLRNLLSISGPANSDLGTAFHFHDRWDLSRRRRRAPSGEDDDWIEDRIHNKYAERDGLFHSARDFWSVVGWAFICSKLHPHRWRYWNLWLEYMLDVLQADWVHRQGIDEQTTGPDGNPCKTHRRDSLLLKYIEQVGSGRFRANHILKALFADGNTTSRRLFGEVFRNETKEASQSSNEQTVSAVNLDKDEYGGYMDFTDSEEEEDGEEGGSKSLLATPKTPKSPHMSGQGVGDIPAGLVESIPLRIRCFALLSKATSALPSEMTGFDGLRRDFMHYLKEQPPGLFQLFVGRLADFHNGVGVDESEREAIVVILTGLLDDLLPAARDDTEKHMSNSRGNLAFTGPALTHCYLPWSAAADDLEDNARVSTLLEIALQMTDPEDLRLAPGLRDAAEKGVRARSENTKLPARRQKQKQRQKQEKQRKLSRAELHLKEMIELSGERMLLFIDCMTGKYDSYVGRKAHS